MSNDDFLNKLLKAVELNLEYFDQPKEKPNLSRDKFVEIIKLANSEDMTVRFDTRETKKGANAKNAELDVFHLNFEIRVLLRKKAYYAKGYFFDATELKGVFIHSFREN